MVNLAKNWWLLVLRGVAAILFGLAAFVWPGLTLLLLITLFALYAIVDGLIALITGLNHTHDSPRWWVFALEGLVGVGIGVIALAWPNLTALAILAMIAAWAVLTGILEIVAAIRLRREIENEWFLVLGGILSVGVGILLIAQPLAGTVAIVWTIGAYELISGVLWILLAVRLRSHEMTSEPTELFSSIEKGLHLR